MTNEKLINVPLDDETKAALEMSAAENGRAVGREAAQLIKAEMRQRIQRMRAAHAVADYVRRNGGEDRAR